MKIDAATLVVSFIVVGLFAAPFLLDMAHRRNKGRRLLRSLAELAQRHQCTLHHQTTCGPVALGLDTQRQMLLFVDQSAPEDTMHAVDLRQVNTAKAVAVPRGNRQGQAAGELERVELALHYREAERPPLRLLLHQADQNAPTGNELAVAQEWAQRMNAMR